MKILHIHPSLASGGIEAMICGLANEMAKCDNVSVCSIFAPKNNDVFWDKLSSDVRRLSLSKLKRGFSIAEIFKIYALIKKEKFEVVNLHGFFYYYALAIFLLHRRVRFFYTVHSDAKMENRSWDKHLFLLKKIFFKLNWIKPITISEFSKESFTKLYKTDSKLIYNGVPKPIITVENVLQPYRMTSKTKLFIHAGRISIEKNQLTLCKVFKKLLDEGNDIVLLIAGNIHSIEIYTEIEQYFCDRIIYIGERSNIPQLMNYSDAMCLPSIWEGLPVTLLESLSVGCIPICSPVGGIPNVIANGENGLLSKTCSETDYYDTIKYYLSLSDEKISVMKKMCCNSFQNFEIKKCAKDYLNYYKGLY